MSQVTSVPTLGPTMMENLPLGTRVQFERAGGRTVEGRVVSHNDDSTSTVVFMCDGAPFVKRVPRSALIGL